MFMKDTYRILNTIYEMFSTRHDVVSELVDLTKEHPLVQAEVVVIA
jgi:hypothetical protein